MSSCNGVGKESSVTSDSNVNDQIPLPYIKQEPLDDYECQATQNNSANNQVIPIANNQVIPIANNQVIPIANNQVIPIIDVEHIKKEPTPQLNCSSGVIPVYTISDDSNDANESHSSNQSNEATESHSSNQSNEANESCSSKLSKQNEILTFKHPSGVDIKLTPISSVAPPYRRQIPGSQHTQNDLRNANLRPLGSNRKRPIHPRVSHRQRPNRKEVNSTPIIQNGNNSSKDINYREHLLTSNDTAINSFVHRFPPIEQFTYDRNFLGFKPFPSIPNKVIHNETQNRMFNHNVQSLNSHVGLSNIVSRQGETARNFPTQDQGVENLINFSRSPTKKSKNCARAEQNEGLNFSAAFLRQVKQAGSGDNLNVPSFSSAFSVPGNQLSISNISVTPSTNVSTSGSSARRKIAKKKIRRIETRDSARNDFAGSTLEKSKPPPAHKNFNLYSGKSLKDILEYPPVAVTSALSPRKKNSSPKISPSFKKPKSPSKLNGKSSPKKSQNSVNASSNSPIPSPTNLVFKLSANSELRKVELTDFSTVENKEVSTKKASKEYSRKKPKRKSVSDAETCVSNTSSLGQTCSPLSDNCFESTNQPLISASPVLDVHSDATDKVVVESVDFRSQSKSMNPVTLADGKNSQMSEKTDSSSKIALSYREQYEKISSASEDSASFGSPSVSPSLLNTTLGQNFSLNLMQNMGNNLRSEQNNASDQRNCSSSLTNSFSKTSDMDPFIPDGEPIPFFRHKIRDFDTNLSETLNSQEILRHLMPNNEKSSFGNEKNFPINPSLNYQITELDSIPETNNLLCAESIANYLLSSGQETCDNEFSTSCSSTVQSEVENEMPRLFDERNDPMSVNSYQDCNNQIQTSSTRTTEQIASNSCDVSQREGSFRGDAESLPERSFVSHAEILQNSEEPASTSHKKNDETNGLTNGNDFPNFSVKLLCLSEKCDYLYTQDNSKYYSFNLGNQFLIRSNSLLTHAVHDNSISASNSVANGVQQDNFSTDEHFYELLKNFEIHSPHKLSNFKLMILEMRGYNSSGFICRSVNKEETVYECENFWLSFQTMLLQDVKGLVKLIEYSKSVNAVALPSAQETNARSSSVLETSEKMHKPNSVLYFWPAQAFAYNNEKSLPPDDCISFLPSQPENVETVAKAKSMIFIVFTNLKIIDLAQVISQDPKFAELFGSKPTASENNVVSFIDDRICSAGHTEMQMNDNPEFLNETVAPQNSLSSFLSWQNETNLEPNERLLNYAENDGDEIVIVEERPITNNLNREETSVEKFSRLENSKTYWNINNYSVTKGRQNSEDPSLAGSPNFSTSVNFDGNLNLDNGINSSTRQQQYHTQSNSDDDDDDTIIADNAFYQELSEIPEIRRESLEPVNNRSIQGSSQPTFSYDPQQIQRYRNDNSANASAQDILYPVNNPHFMLHSSQTGAKSSTNETSTFIGNSAWNQNFYNDGHLRSFHYQELGIAHAPSTCQPLGLTPEARPIPFGMLRQIPNPNLISPPSQAEISDGGINNQHRILGQLERCLDRYEENLELRNPQWNVLSSSSIRCEPVRAHTNYRGGAHLHSTSRPGTDRSFLQTSGGNIVREEMDRHSIYRNINSDFNSSYPDQDTAINYSLAGEGARHTPSCPPNNFSNYSGLSSRGVGNNLFSGQFRTHIDSPHTNPPVLTDSLYAHQREEESPRSNSDTSPPCLTIVPDLSINEGYNIPEDVNLYTKTSSLPKRQTSTNFSTPDSGHCSNSETESVSRFQRHSNARIACNMQSMNPVDADEQAMLVNEINRAIYDKNEGKLCELLHVSAQLNNNPQFLRIKAYLAMYHAQYEEVIQIIKNAPEHFPIELHKELQLMWLQAWESLETKKFQANPKPKTKDKHPFPETIYVDTQKVLNDAYERDQYPKLPARQHIADLIGIHEKQVCNWFKNRRQREKRKASGMQDAPRRGGRRGRKRNTPPEPDYIPSFATNSQSLPVFPGIQNIDPFNVPSVQSEP